MRQAWQILKQTVSRFLEDNAMTLAAALSFYGALSLAPLVLLLVTVSGLLGEQTQQRLVGQVEAGVGAGAAGAVRMVTQNARDQQDLATVAGIIGVVALLFSASAVFAQLQAAMNQIWRTGKQAQGIGAMILKRLISMATVLLILVLLLVAVGASAVVGGMLRGSGVPWQPIDLALSLVLFTLLFALLFRVLPDAHVDWQDIWLGAAITALLFVVGKHLIAWYLATASVGSAYGAAGSLIAFLVWVYYSSVIFLFGAEFVWVYANRHDKEAAQ